MSFEIGTQIYASSVQRGMVIEVMAVDTDTVNVVDVERITEGFSTWTFITGSGGMYPVNYGDLVTLRGWFNPEPLMAMTNLRITEL